MQVTKALSFIRDMNFADLPQGVVTQAKRALLDLTGVAASGRSTALSGIVARHAVRHMASGGGKPARILFDGRPASAVGAAYAGAALIDSFDAHDGHRLTKGHAGVAILPALLALHDAEAGDDDDRTFLADLVLGYEIATRAGMALHASVSDYHTSGAWNALGCAAISARRLGLSTAATREALGIAEYHGPRSQMMRCIDHPTMVKDGSDRGAMIGVSAAYLAADGFTGAPAITVEAPEHAEIWSDLGERWRMTEQYFKPYPVCRWAQPAIEAVAGLTAQHRLGADDVAAVEIGTFAEAVRLAARRPATTEQAQYSLPFPLAAMIRHGRVGAAEITGAGLGDPDVLALSDAIVLVEDPLLCARFPAERLAVATLVTRDGRRLVSPITGARGDPEAPLSDAEIEAKFRSLAASLGRGRVDRIVETVAAFGTGVAGLAGSYADLVTAPIRPADEMLENAA